MHAKKKTHWVHVAPLCAVVLWGGIYPGSKLGLQDIPVLSFALLRILLALVILFGASGLADPRPFSLPRWKPLVGAGLAQTTFQGLLIAGLHRTTAGNSALLLATAPLLTTGWLALRGSVRLVARQWYGLVLGLGGVGLLVQGSELGFAWSHLAGDLLALGAAGAWAWYGIAIGPLVETSGAMRATGWTMMVAALCFLPLAFAEVKTHGGGVCHGRRGPVFSMV